ncbi:hypothetical protein J7T55_015098 [Diaporthe amygdali]|uniref:uncharacterized protein n=1 Tax=Phomopsis amygdali TaxID=1214568 RepID=UPI0022FDC726|nr:uncharacterized protein J7T55_015098 [Diaporthe amygdali]KAJ0108664.1 hypothetical protein J7T55_015098 [Diaporthe amygdali]
MKFSITGLLVSALAVGLAQAACQTRETGCSPESVCQGIISGGQGCGSTETASGCTLSGATVTVGLPRMNVPWLVTHFLTLPSY